jgi:CDP-glycerol glycerophosphotransferase
VQVVYHSFEGRYSDNPRALYEVLVGRTGDVRHLWLAADEHLQGFPAGVETVRYGSAECIAALEAADLVIANTHTDLQWRKREGAVYLQTWHGTPLKRIHHDVLWAPEGRLERLSGDVAQWDMLVSPCEFATAALRGAFGFDGEVLETGYPRNDALLAPDHREVRARVRAELGIRDGVTAVLYTPTWRDDEVFQDGERQGDEPYRLQLDAAAFDERLGGEHHLLLRLHYTQTGRLQAVSRDAVTDVSFHPDIRELYLAADVLVTDYSSTMFDFAITGKPIVLFAYDLERFRDAVRGFYLDVEEIAPGPVVRTSDELLDVLANLPEVRAAHAERLGRFRERFCSLEDGHASDRVLSRLGLLVS